MFIRGTLASNYLHSKGISFSLSCFETVHLSARPIYLGKWTLPMISPPGRPRARFSKVPITFRALKVLLCLLRLHSSFNNLENDIIKLSVNEAKLTGLWARNCATFQQILILKFAFELERLPGLSRNGPLGPFRLEAGGSDSNYWTVPQSSLVYIHFKIKEIAKMVSIVFQITLKKQGRRAYATCTRSTHVCTWKVEGKKTVYNKKANYLTKANKFKKHSFA